MERREDKNNIKIKTIKLNKFHKKNLKKDIQRYSTHRRTLYSKNQKIIHNRYFVLFPQKYETIIQKPKQIETITVGFNSKK